MTRISNIPEDLRYSRDHEWIRVTTDASGKKIGRVGITWHAQNELGDIVFLELPAGGRAVSKGDAIAVVESVKSVSDIFAPVAGTISARHENLDPSVLNADPYGEGWLFEIDLGENSADGLLTAEEYAAHIGNH